MSPVHLHPTVMLEAILEVATAEATGHAAEAVAAVSVSPTKSCAKHTMIGAKKMLGHNKVQKKFWGVTSQVRFSTPRNTVPADFRPA